MFSKITIGMRITTGFLSIVVLMAALGIFSVFQLKIVQGHFEEIGLEGARAMTRLGVMRSAVQKQAVLIRDIASYEDLSIQKAAIKELKEAETTAAAASAALLSQSAMFDSALQQLLKQATQKYALIRPISHQAIAAVQDMDIDQAKDKVYKQLRPLQAELDALLDKAQDDLSKSAEQAVQTSAASVRVLIFVLGER